MKTVDFIFVNREIDLSHKLVGDIVIATEHGESFNAHVAVRFPYIDNYGPKILEALRDGVQFTDCDKYSIDPKIAYITVEVSDEDYDLMQKEAVRIAEHKYKYSYKSCAAGGVADNLGETAGKVVAAVLNCNDDDEMDCSEVATLIARKPWPWFMGDWVAPEITPEHFFKHMIMYGSEGKIKIVKAQYGQFQE